MHQILSSKYKRPVKCEVNSTKDPCEMANDEVGSVGDVCDKSPLTQYDIMKLIDLPEGPDEFGLGEDSSEGNMPSLPLELDIYREKCLKVKGQLQRRY